MPLITALRKQRQRQEDLCGFKATLAYKWVPRQPESQSETLGRGWLGKGGRAIKEDTQCQPPAYLPMCIYVYMCICLAQTCLHACIFCTASTSRRSSDPPKYEHTHKNRLSRCQTWWYIPWEAMVGRSLCIPGQPRLHSEFQ